MNDTSYMPQQRQPVRQRRGQPRVPAEPQVMLITVASRFTGIMEDISVAGARIVLREKPPREGRDLLLRWSHFEAFGQVVWTRGMTLGLAFHQRIPPHYIADTTGTEVKLEPDLIDRALSNI